MIFCKLCITEMIKIFIRAVLSAMTHRSQSHVPSCHKQATVIAELPRNSPSLEPDPRVPSRHTPDMASKPKNLNIKIRFRESAHSASLAHTTIAVLCNAATAGINLIIKSLKHLPTKNPRLRPVSNIKHVIIFLLD